MVCGGLSEEVTFRQIKGAGCIISRGRMSQVEDGEEDLSCLGTTLVWERGGVGRHMAGHEVQRGGRAMARRCCHQEKEFRLYCSVLGDHWRVLRTGMLRSDARV